MKLYNKNKAGFSLIELSITIAIIVICTSLLLPAVQKARNLARASQCKNNLKRLGIALHNYHETFGCFPPGWVSHTPYAQSKSAYGWQTMILPMIEQAPLYDNLSGLIVPVGKEAFGREGTTRNGMKVFDIEKNIIAAFRCPDDTTAPLNTMRGGWGTSNYSGNFGSTIAPRIAPNDTAYFWPGSLITPLSNNGMFYMNSRIKFRDITDGTSNTIMVGERGIKSAAGIWAGVRSNSIESDQVTDSSFGNEINSNPGAFSSLHPQGAYFTFGDGRVKLISEKIDSRAITTQDQAGGTFQKIATISGDEIIGEY